MDVEADVNRGSRKLVQVAKDELLGHIFSQGELSESNLFSISIYFKNIQYSGYSKEADFRVTENFRVSLCM